MSNSSRSSKSKTNNKKNKKKTAEEAVGSLVLSYRALESRMVFDAAMEATIDAASDAPATVGEVAAAAETVALAEALVGIAGTGSADAPTTIVFIDQSVTDRGSILAALPAGTEVVVLDGDSDALGQIAQALEGRTGLASIHIISHGVAGTLEFASGSITAADLNAHGEELAAIGRALSENGDILVYGCDVAAGTQGQAFLDALASLTGADVAGSIDDTGAVALGGDWVLETQTGAIETNELAAPAWDGLLAITANNDTASITAVIPPATNPTVTGNVATNDVLSGTVTTAKTVVQVHGYDTWGGSPAVGTSIPTAYGSIVINADGSYTYTVDSANSTVRGLSGTQSVQDVIGYTIRDSAGNRDWAYLTVTVTGVSEAPVAFDNNRTVTTVTAPTASGNILTDNDGSGTDTIDRPISQFIWEGTNPATGTAYFANGANVIGHSRTVDGVGVTISGTNTSSGTTTRTYSNATQGGHTGYFNWALDPATGTYTAPTTTFTFTQPVINLSFGLTDLDISGAPVGGVVNWQDAVVITGTRNVGGVDVPVTFTPQASGRLTTTGGGTGFEGLGETGFVNVIATDVDGNVQIVFDGPVDKVTITFKDGSLTNPAAANNPGNHVIGMTDMSWQNPNSVSVLTVDSTMIAATGNTIVAGTYGTLTIAANGSYTYTVNDTNPAVIALPAGSTLLEDFNYTIRDANGNTTSAVLYITVNGINEVPVLDLNGGVAGTSYSNLFIENGSPVNIGDATTTITDADSGSVVANATIVLTNKQLDDVLTVGSLPPGVTANVDTSNPAQITITLTGSATKAQYAAAIAAITFSNTSENPSTADRNITAVVSDGFANSNTAVATIKVSAVNDAPTAAPDTNSVAENASVSGTVLPNDNDIDGGTLTVAAINGAAGGVGTGVAGSNGGTFTILSNGSYTFNAGSAFDYLAPGQTTTTQVSYTISDGQGGTATSTVTITVTGTNDGPVALPDTNATTENASVSGTVVSNDSDIDGGTITVSAVNGVAGNVGAGVTGSNGGTFTVTSAGGYTFDPGTAFDYLAAGATATTQVNYTISDGQGGTATATVTVTITGTNDAPTATPDTNSTTENASVSGTVLPNDSDVDGGALTVSAVNGVAGNVGTAVAGNNGGTFTIASNGTYTFNPGTAFDYLAPGATATSQVFYTVSDGQGGTATTTVTVTITGTNDGPVAVADTNTTTENASVSGTVLPNDSDIDGGTLAVSAVNGVAGNVGSAVAGNNGGTFTINSNGTYTFNPGTSFDYLAPGATATTQVSYTVSDGQGGTATTTVTVTVTGTNDGPTAVADTNSTLENAPVSGNVLTNDSDPDGGTLSVSAVNGVAGNVGTGIAGNNGGTFTVNANGTYTFNPGTSFDYLAPGVTATTQVSYTVSDGQGGTSTATVTVTVTGTNDGPVAVADTNSTTENAPVSGTVLPNDSDIDGGTLTVSAVNGVAGNVGTGIAGSAGGTFTVNANGTYTFNPGTSFDYLAPGATATTQVSYTVSDGQGGSATTTLTVTVIGTNDAPVAVNDTNSASENASVSGTVLPNDSDVDGGTLTVSAVNGSAGNVGSGVTGTNGGTFTVNANGTYTFNPGTAFDYLAPGATATTQVTYTVSDGQGGTATATVTITVTGTNDGPVAAPDTNATNENVAVSGSVLPNDSDVDGGTLVVSAVNGIAGNVGTAVAGSTGGTFTILSNGTYTFNPGTSYDYLAPGQTTTSQVSYTVSDGQGGTATTTVTITITGTNDGPVAVNDVNSANENASVSGTVLPNDSDIDGGTLTVSSVNGVAGNVGSGIAGTNGGTFTVNTDGTYSFNPGTAFDYLAPGQTTTTQVNYTVADGQGGTATATVTITVTGINDAPVAVADTNSTSENASVFGTVLPNDGDIDGGTLTVSAVNGVAGNVGTGVAGNNGGTFTILSNGTYSFNPGTSFDYLAPGQTTTTQAFYTVSDGQGGTATTTVTITVTGTNDGPLAVADTNSTTENAPVTGTVLPNDSDIDGGTLTVSAVNGLAANVGTGIAGTNGGTFTVNTDGTYSFNPDTAFDYLAPGATTTSQVTYTVSDGQGGTATTTLTVTVTGTNDGPVATPDTNATSENSSVSGNILPNDSDIDGGTLSVSAVNGVAGNVGSGVTGSNGGTFTINSNGTYTFVPGAAFDYLAPGQTTTTQVTYTVSDGQGGNASTTVTVTLTGTNDTPIAVADINSTSENTIASGNVLPNDTDVDNGTKTVAAVNGVIGNVGNGVMGTNGGTFTIASNGAYTFDPGTSFDHLAPGQTATTQVGYTMSDGQGGQSTTTLTVTVTGVNDGPAAVADVNTGNSTTVLNVGPAGGVLGNDTDPENDALTVSAVNGSAGNLGTQVAGTSGGLFTVNADGSYSFDPNGDFFGIPPGGFATTSVTYTIVDPYGVPSSTTLTITVPYDNLPPYVQQPIPGQTSADGDAVSISVANVFADVNPGDTITLTVGGLPAGLSFDPLTNTIVGTLGPDASVHDPYTISVTADDGHGGVVTTTFQLTVSNPQPVANPDSGAVTEHGTMNSAVLGNDADGGNDGDGLAVSAVNGNPADVGTQIALPSGALLTMNSDGTYDYDPNGAFDGLAQGITDSDTFQYTISDGQGGFATATVTITITGQNDTPAAVADINNTTENASVSGTVIPNDTDPDGDALTVSAVSGLVGNVGASVPGSNGGTFTIATSGAYTFNPGTAFDYLAPGQTATTQVNYTSSDGKGGSSNTTLTITVTGTNDGPVARPDTNATAENSSVTGTVLPNDSDIDGGTLTVAEVNGAVAGVGTAVAGTNGGTFTILSNGTYTFNPGTSFDTLAPGATATTQVTYTVADGQGGFDSTTLTITVTGTNDGPTAVADTNSTLENSPVSGNVLPNDGDIDGGTLVVTAVNGVSGNVGTGIPGSTGGTFTVLSTGAYTFDPGTAFDYLAPGATATTQVTYTVSDGQGGFATTTLTVAVTGTNDGPTAQPNVATTSENATVTGQVLTNDSDPDGGTLSVSEVNGQPLNVGQPVAGTAGGSFTILSNGTYTFNPGTAFDHLAPGESTTTQVSYTLSDGQGGTSTTTVTITVTGANDAPVAIADVNSTTDDVPVSGNVIPNDTDVDGDTLTVAAVNGNAANIGTAVSGTSGGTFTIATNGTYTFNPGSAFDYLAPGATTTTQVSYTVTDGAGGSSVTTVTVTVTGTNDGPVALPDTNATTESASVSGNVLPNDGDIDSGTLTVSAVNGVIADVGAGVPGTNGGTFTILPNGSYTFNPGTSFESLPVGQTATTQVSYTVADGQGGFATTTLTVTVTGENDPPIVINPLTPGVPPVDPDHVVPAQTGNDGSAIVPLNVAPYFTDPDTGDMLTLSVDPTQLPPGVTFYPLTGTFSGTPTPNASVGGPNNDGVYEVVVTADDGHGGTVTTIITFDIANPPPVAVNDTFSVGEHGTASGTIITNDHDTAPDNDAISVAEVNGNPASVGNPILLPSGATLTLNADGTFSYDPNGAFDGLGVGQQDVDSFTYTITDGQGGTSTATVDVTITGQNDTPVVVDPLNPGTPPNDPLHIVPSQTAFDGSPITSISVLSYFGDPDGGDSVVLSVNPAMLPDGISFNALTGTFSGTPGSDASQGGPGGNGVYPIVVTATDEHGATVTTIVTFSIGNAAPVADNDAFTTGEHAVATGNVLPGDHDGGGDDDDITVTEVNGQAAGIGTEITLPSGALLTLNADGTYSYDPNGAFPGLAFGQSMPDSFTYTISDGQGGTSTATVNVTVEGRNEPPVVIDPQTGLPPADPLHVVPVALGQDGAVMTPLQVSSYFTDADVGDTITLSVVPSTLPPGITFDAGTGTFSGTPTPDASIGGTGGVYTVVVTATDSQGGTATTIVTFQISNPAPFATNDDFSVNEHNLGSGQVLGNDADGGNDDDNLTVVALNGSTASIGNIVTLPSGAKLELNADGTYDYDPSALVLGLAAGETGSDSFTYTISDGQGGTATATVTVTIIGQNDQPYVVDPLNPGVPPTDPQHIVPTQTAADGSPITAIDLTPYFADPDNSDVLSFAVDPATLPVGLTIDPVTGILSGTPGPNASQGGPNGDGVYHVLVTVGDGNGGSVTTLVTFTITNPAPVATADTNTASEDAGVITGAVLLNDKDGGSDTDPLTVTAINGSTGNVGLPVTLTSGAIVTINPDGTYSYDPNGKFEWLGVGETATETFTYTVSDGQGGTATATVTITITGQNDNPYIVNPLTPGVPPTDPNHVVPVVSGTDGTAIPPIDLTQYFADPDASDNPVQLTVDPTTLPPGIVFDPVTGTFSGTPTTDASVGGPNSDGIYEVVVTGTDGNGGVVTTIVTFTITNPVPVAVDDFATTSPDTAVTIAVLGNDSDDDAITVVSASSPNGEVVINPDGTISFTPGPGFVGVADIVYTISDGQGGTATAHVKVLVTPQTIVTGVTEVNVPPVVQLSPSPQVSADGVIASTVQAFESLGGISNTLGTNGIILATANQIGHLGSLGHTGTNGRSTITDPTQPWRIEQAFGGYGGHEQGTWDPKGLTGFSLRFTFAEDFSTHDKAQIVLESLVRERTLIVRLSSTELPNHAHVIDYSVMQADGKPLPIWLDRAGGDLLIGNRPIDSEELKLRVIARLSDGTTIERHVVIQSVTGEIQPLQLERRADLAPIFTDQLERETRRASVDIDSLAAALADRG